MCCEDLGECSPFGRGEVGAVGHVYVYGCHARYGSTGNHRPLVVGVDHVRKPRQRTALTAPTANIRMVGMATKPDPCDPNEWSWDRPIISIALDGNLSRTHTQTGLRAFLELAGWARAIGQSSDTSTLDMHELSCGCKMYRAIASIDACAPNSEWLTCATHRPDFGPFAFLPGDLADRMARFADSEYRISRYTGSDIGVWCIPLNPKPNQRGRYHRDR